jgi:hypothetical protein
MRLSKASVATSGNGPPVLLAKSSRAKRTPRQPPQPVEKAIDRALAVKKVRLVPPQPAG